MTNKELIRRIGELKAKRNAIILAHNYQVPEVQDIADITGDSLELSRKAAETEASVIVFCGVHFMAETAAILNPDKVVLLPRKDAGCLMADMITPQDMEWIRREFTDTPIITYVNSTAEVKAMSTICCTSANAVSIARRFAEYPLIYMTPDRNLAMYVAKFVENKVQFWNGYCPVHDSLTPEHVLKQKEKHPEAVFIAHPECRPEVIELADQVFSTSGMLKFVEESDNEEFIVGTEIGILHTMKKRAPNKKFYPAWDLMICNDMKKTSLMDVLKALETMKPRITVPESVRIRALDAIMGMLQGQ
ncbi:MAG: quinolinate synthase NadA [Deltaproteobacteria bacterium]|nr:quinolinate synthase NadA [Deltaproteobacteria bacterium]MBW2067360.1 quinolinate synthase NadA [Deltaproteobacteria bacterium]